MHKRVLGTSVAAATFAAMTLAACGSSGVNNGASSGSSQSSGSGAKSDPKGPIKVDVIAPFSGAEGYLGAPTINGLELALKDIGGKIDGRSVQLVKADDQCSPANAVQLVRKISSESSVSAVFGPICSGSMAAVQKTMARDQIVHVTNGYGATLTTVGDKFIFVGVANNNQQVQALKPFVAAQHATKVALVQGDDGYSQQLAGSEKALLKQMHIKVAYDGTFQDTATDYSGQISGIKSSGAQLVMVAAYESNTGAFLKQLRQEGVNLPVGAPSGCDPAATSVAGTNATKVGFALNFCPTYPAFRSFTNAYKAQYHSTPDDAVAGAYTGGIALFKGLEESHGQGGVALQKAMLALNYHSKLGNLSYTSTGSLKNPEIVTGQLINGTARFTK